MHAKFQVNRQLISKIKEGGLIPPPPEREGVEKYHLRERVNVNAALKQTDQINFDCRYYSY